jgi:hypothetical protein
MHKKGIKGKEKKQLRGAESRALEILFPWFSRTPSASASRRLKQIGGSNQARNSSELIDTQKQSRLTIA